MSDAPADDLGVRFNYLAEPNTFRRWFLAHVVTDPTRSNPELLAELSARTNNFTDVHVRVLVNDVEVDGGSFLANAERQIQRAARVEAVRLVREVTDLTEVHRVLHDLADAVEGEVHAAARRLNVTLDWDEE